jgi:hypothetical protein
MSNGGMIIGNNYHHFARFKLIDIGRQHPDLMDVAITRFAETLCEEGCDRDAVWTEYDITGVGQPREDLYGYKYVVDVDGTTFSGRFLGLLRSGSLVFKVSIHFQAPERDLKDKKRSLRCLRSTSTTGCGHLSTTCPSSRTFLISCRKLSGQTQTQTRRV